LTAFSPTNSPKSRIGKRETPGKGRRTEGPIPECVRPSFGVPGFAAKRHNPPSRPHAKEVEKGGVPLKEKKGGKKVNKYGSPSNLCVYSSSSFFYLAASYGVKGERGREEIPLRKKEKEKERKRKNEV